MRFIAYTAVKHIILIARKRGEGNGNILSKGSFAIHEVIYYYL